MPALAAAGGRRPRRRRTVIRDNARPLRPAAARRAPRGPAGARRRRRACGSRSAASTSSPRRSSAAIAGAEEGRLIRRRAQTRRGCARLRHSRAPDIAAPNRLDLACSSAPPAFRQAVSAGARCRRATVRRARGATRPARWTRRHLRAARRTSSSSTRSGPRSRSTPCCSRSGSGRSIPTQLLDRTPPLEVALVNAKSKAKPAVADILAQANLDGGGNTDANRRAKTPLPVLPKASADRRDRRRDADGSTCWSRRRGS